MTSDAANADKKKPVTVSHVFGEIVWLLSQSERHANITASDMNWLIMPPVLNRQFHIFREAERPIGAALWAMLDEASERKVMGGLRDSNVKLEDTEWTAGDHLWLIELIAPFATVENRHAELMIADLVTGPFSKRSFKMLNTKLNSSDQQVVEMPADAGERLVKQTLAMAGATNTCQ
ncbi:MULTISPECIES: toxin-activating lysine-acyltransferase [Sphingobium]|uniref:toxin-activating lysine-acyltransferase n=1 Tax=Sphingobium TaxID=165695 RepID=UPI000E720FCC|nr:toxin-activating lysine-acyltransferase [Sphingobium sp. YG1]